MARVRIELPENMLFVGSIPVRITDINHGGHVGNDSIVSIIHEARIQFLNKLGYEELDMEKVGLVMSDLAVEYKIELFYGDVINVYVKAGDFTRISFDVYYQFRKISGDKEIVATNAKTGMVCYDFNERKVVSLPPAAKVKLENA